MRFRLSRLLLALALATPFLAACDSGGPEVQLGALRVEVRLPEGYAQPGAPGAALTLTAQADGTTRTATTNDAGEATFTDLLPGIYSLTARLSLSEDAAFALTGLRQAVELNASEPAVTLPASEPVVLQLAGSALGGLVIKEVYYTGSRTPGGGNYFSDQFVEIVNNSTETIFADGLMIADVFGVSGQINPGSQPTPFQSDQNHVYVNSVWRVPGSGQEHPIPPGGSLLIAQDGIDHRTDPLGNPNSPVDLSSADWETFNQRDDGRDIDSPTVPNLERLYFTGGFDWLLPVFGPGVVIFRAPDFDALARVPIPGSSLPERIQVPIGLVIDAFEALQNPQSGAFKRIPVALDAGFVSASGTYTSESARRRVARVVAGRTVYQDTNNSSADFEIISPPTPRSGQALRGTPTRVFARQTR
ncbi:MAG: DUF4876 domain-containing protein [Rubricoccaceae bacterium]